MRGPGAVQGLKPAERSIRHTESRLARVPAPAVARGLRTKLLRVYRLNAGLARETVLLAAGSRRAPCPPVRRGGRRAGSVRTAA